MKKMFSIFFRKQPKEYNKQRDYDNFSVFLSSYRNMIFNQSACVSPLGYFLIIFMQLLRLWVCSVSIFLLKSFMMLRVITLLFNFWGLLTSEDINFKICFLCSFPLNVWITISMRHGLRIRFSLFLKLSCVYIFRYL